MIYFYRLYIFKSCDCRYHVASFHLSLIQFLFGTCHPNLKFQYLNQCWKCKSFVFENYVTEDVFVCVFVSFFFNATSWDWDNYFCVTCVLIIKLFCCSEAVWPGAVYRGSFITHKTSQLLDFFLTTYLKGNCGIFHYATSWIWVQHSAVTKSVAFATYYF